MKRFAYFLLVLFVCGPPECGGERISFRSEEEELGSGGAVAAVGGAAAGEDFGVYRRAGYAGGQAIMSTLPQGATTDQSSIQACTAEGGAARSHYDTTSCRAGTLCSPYCTKDEDCPSLAGRMATCGGCLRGGEPSRCAPEGRSCVLLCVNDDDCPTDMACLPDGVGRVCMFVDVPRAPGCEGYCASVGDECGAGAPCCEGTSCAPWGLCEARSCLPFAWECGAALDCCEPFMCRDGYCQSAP